MSFNIVLRTYNISEVWVNPISLCFNSLKGTENFLSVPWLILLRLEVQRKFSVIIRNFRNVCAQYRLRVVRNYFKWTVLGPRLKKTPLTATSGNWLPLKLTLRNWKCNKSRIYAWQKPILSNLSFALCNPSEYLDVHKGFKPQNTSLSVRILSHLPNDMSKEESKSAVIGGTNMAVAELQAVKIIDSPLQ